jgi:acetyl-CoA carboxylase alpha subunit
MSLSEMNARLAIIKNDAETSRQRASEAATKTATAREKTAEALKHMGIVNTLLQEANVAHQEVHTLLLEGSSKITGMKELQPDSVVH